MARVTAGTTRAARHKKLRKLAKGFRGFRGHTLKGAKEGIFHSLKNSFVGRRRKKRDMRRLWITRMNAALRSEGTTYSLFMHKATEKHLGIDRKIMSKLAVHDPKTFSTIVKEVQK